MLLIKISHFVETDEEFIEELRNTKKSTDYRTNIFPTMGKDEKKNLMSNLKKTKYQSLTKPSIILPFM